MIPVFVLSLRDCTARRKSISDILEQLQIPFEFIDAVDGRCGLDPKHFILIDREAARRDGRVLTDAEYACALSHINIYERIVRERIPWTLVLEDDALPTTELVRFLEERHYETADLTQLAHGKGYVRKAGSLPVFDGHRSYLRLPKIKLPCTTAYVISEAAAHHFSVNAVPVTREADWPKCIETLIRGRRARVVYPELVGHGSAGDMETTIPTSYIAESRNASKEKRRFFGVYIPPWRRMLQSYARSPLKLIGKKIVPDHC